MSAGNTVRGIDHVGITVPDLDEASAFLVAALGAEVLYDMQAPADQPVAEDADRESRARLGIRAGARWIRSRMLRLGNGASIELFEYADDDQRPPVGASDLGIQHFAVYVDDIHAARRQIVEAGGTALAGPTLLPGPESGENNMWLYTIAPWGSVIELVTAPSPQRHEEITPFRRWNPEGTQANSSVVERKERS